MRQLRFSWRLLELLGHPARAEAHSEKTGSMKPEQPSCGAKGPLGYVGLSYRSLRVNGAAK
jgi:hypothetical protein